jgi:surfeit locus 1 family protein
MPHAWEPPACAWGPTDVSGDTGTSPVRRTADAPGPGTDPASAAPPGGDGGDGGDGGRDRRHPLLRPVWVAASVVVLVVLVTFPQLGLWQWERYREVQADNARLTARLDDDPVSVTDVLPPDLPDDGPGREVLADLEYTPVQARGTYVAEEQVAQRGRSLDGNGGFDLLTPLSLGDGTAVLVRRGWVPPDGTGSADPTRDVPVEEEVVVTGFLEAPVGQPTGIGPRDPDDGELETVFHADVERLDRQTDESLRPMLLHLVDQDPGDGDLPVAQPVVVEDATQNLSYTLQWFAFTLIVGLGYAIVVRRRLRDHRAGVDTDVDPLLRGRTPAQGRGGPPRHPDRD